jgi:hypothetical protein
MAEWVQTRSTTFNFQVLKTAVSVNNKVSLEKEKIAQVNKSMQQDAEIQN